MAFDHFARKKVEIAVIETGLGGRLDATNVLEPLLTIITDISFDHAEILGPTLGDIAGEKAGIIKPGVPLVTGLLPPEAARVIRATCRERGAKLIPLKRGDFTLDRKRLRLDYHEDGCRFRGLAPSLPGLHQLKNAALVLKACGQLRQRGLALTKDHLGRGLKAVEWPGRFQILPGREGAPTWLLDVCHNRAGAAAFADTFARLYPGRKVPVILGLVKRKEHQAIVDQFARVADRFCLVPLASKRSVDIKQILTSIDWHGRPVKPFGRLATARNSLLKDNDSHGIIALVGSHYLVGEYLSKYGKG